MGLLEFNLKFVCLVVQIYLKTQNMTFIATNWVLGICAKEGNKSMKEHSFSALTIISGRWRGEAVIEIYWDQSTSEPSGSGSSGQQEELCLFVLNWAVMNRWEQSPVQLIFNYAAVKWLLVRLMSVWSQSELTPGPRNSRINLIISHF